jgi:hypothetical protein
MVAIRGHFDGKVIVPDEPVDFPRGQALIVHIERDHAKPTTDDGADTAWTEGVAREWEAELSDPREDIYTMEDGEPVDDPR